MGSRVLVTRRCAIAMAGIASVAALFMAKTPLRAQASIIDILTGKNLLPSETTKTPKLPAEVDLWTSRTFYSKDGIRTTVLRRSYDDNGNILEHVTERFEADGSLDYSTNITYTYKDGIPVNRSISSFDGSHATDSPLTTEFDDDGFPIMVAWYEDDRSTASYHSSGYVESEIELDNSGDSPIAVCSYYDEQGYPTGLTFGSNEPYLKAAWEFDEKNHAAILTVQSTEAYWLNETVYQLAKLVLAGESIALDSELSDFLKEYEVSFMPTPDGGALIYIADNFRPYGVYYCETDDRGNITAVYDENGILRYEATHETFQNPTGWAMYMSAYRFVLGIL